MVVALKESSRSIEKIKANIEANCIPSRTRSGLSMMQNNMVAKVAAVPAREDIDLPIEERLIVELYSK